MDVQYYNFIALGIFTLLAASVPVSFLMTSVTLRRMVPGNPVKNTPYESGEAPIGKVRDVDNEYLPFFAIFLPFEVISLVLVLWAIAARSLSGAANYLVMGLAVVSMVFALIGYKFTVSRDGF